MISFARVSAVVGMKVEDYFLNARRSWFRLHEKRRKVHDVPAHHNAQDYVEAYLHAAGISENKKESLFRSTSGRSKKLTAKPITRTDVLRMIERRALEGVLAASVRNDGQAIDPAPEVHCLHCHEDLHVSSEGGIRRSRLHTSTHTIPPQLSLVTHSCRWDTS